MISPSAASVATHPDQLRDDLAAMHRVLGVMVRLLAPLATTDTSDPITAVHLALLRARAKAHIALDSLEGAQ